MRKLILPFFLAVLPACANAQAPLAITQVQIEGDGGANDEFVEIYNVSDKCVNLNGWSLQYKSASGSFPVSAKKLLPDVNLPSGAYFLVANSGYNNSAVAADLVHSSFALSGNSTGATIFLASSTQAVFGTDDVAVQDRFAYGLSVSNTPLGEAPAVPAATEKPAADWAYVRTAFLGNNATDFLIAPSNPRNFLNFSDNSCGASREGSISLPTDSTATATPDTTASSSAAALSKSNEVKILRFLPDPVGEDSGNEWVELKNFGTADVDLTDWLLDDKDTGTGPGGDAYILSGLLLAGEVKRFIIPISHFALNNTGGDEVNLYFSDRSLADRASYTVNAYSGGVFELVNGVWQPPAQNTGGSGGGSGGGSFYLPAYNFSQSLEFSEIFPNPAGEDAGNEWVEFYNSGTATASLEGLLLDSGDPLVLSGHAYPLPKLLVAPLSYIQVKLPKDALSLKNFGQVKVGLFAPDKKLLTSVEYADAPENRAWQKSLAGAWEWNVPTPGLPNIIPEKAQVIFSELLPSPKDDQDEFVELYNLATSTVDLTGFVLSVGSRKKVFLEAEQIGPQSYLTLFADDLPVALRNSGQKIILSDNWGRVVASVQYPLAQKGFSYASLDGRDFIWTASVTPGADNQLILSATSETKTVKTAVPALKKVGSSQPVKMTDDSLTQTLLEQNRELAARLAALQGTVDLLNQRLSKPPVEPEPQRLQDSVFSGWPYLVLVSVCGVLLFWLLKFLPQNLKPGPPL